MKHSIQTRYITKEERIHTGNELVLKAELFELYSEKLLWWNNKINLVSRDVSRETLQKHLVHSLYIGLSEEFRNAEKVIDTGTGGGLPGIPLAIVNPDKHYILNDIIEKKIFAAKNMITALDLRSRVSAVAMKVEKLDIEQGAVIVTKHAFKINELYDFIKEKPWKAMIFLKGYDEALEELSLIEEEFEVSIIKLDPDFMKSFYDGKAVVEVKRR